MIESRLVFPWPQQSNQEFPCPLIWQRSLEISPLVPVFPNTPGRGSPNKPGHKMPFKNWQACHFHFWLNSLYAYEQNSSNSPTDFASISRGCSTRVRHLFPITSLWTTNTWILVILSSFIISGWKTYIMSNNLQPVLQSCCVNKKRSVFMKNVFKFWSNFFFIFFKFEETRAHTHTHTKFTTQGIKKSTLWELHDAISKTT